MTGTHKHQCPSCGAIWEHPDSCHSDEEAHTCPTEGCGGESWWHYLGRGEATVSHSVACRPEAAMAEDGAMDGILIIDMSEFFNILFGDDDNGR